jgi:hypothetical protein
MAMGQGTNGGHEERRCWRPCCDAILQLPAFCTAMAQNYPMTSGDYEEVGMIDNGLTVVEYAAHVEKNQEFAVKEAGSGLSGLKAKMSTHAQVGRPYPGDDIIAC